MSSGSNPNVSSSATAVDVDIGQSSGSDFNVNAKTANIYFSNVASSSSTSAFDNNSYCETSATYDAFTSVHGDLYPHAILSWFVLIQRIT